MAENLIIDHTADKAEKYRMLLPQVEALIITEKDLIANTANVAAAIRETFGFFWVGFYFVRDGELVLGPFQGPVACTRIKYGKGVCGTAWEQGKTICVPDVAVFPGHIACNAASKSEIVIPLYADKQLIGVLDIDSNRTDDFDETDREYLEQICLLIGKQTAAGK